ncbi:TRAP transporter small permease [Phaeobacter sp. HF9A]|uniref:TRAP transporter small permease n=1 Tax=Phaeobacter sp. HF9A TaxID=2721561 RepID=UPI00158ACDEE|nr:TRAP transporter small permease subunit [Phaeobacter sp. HF9A]
MIIALSNGLHRIARSVAMLAVAGMFTTVMIQVVARYVFSSPPIWTEDVARYMMVWTGLLGTTLSFKGRADAVLMQSVFAPRPSFAGLLSEAIRSAAVLSFILPVIWFSFIGLRGGFAKGYLARQSGLTADTLGIAMAWIAVIVPITMIIILIHLMAQWAGDTDAQPDVSSPEAGLD